MLTPSMSRYLLLLSVVVNFFILGNFLGKSTKDKKLTTTCVSLTWYSTAFNHTTGSASNVPCMTNAR